MIDSMTSEQQMRFWVTSEPVTEATLGPSDALTRTPLTRDPGPHSGDLTATALLRLVTPGAHLQTCE